MIQQKILVIQTAFIGDVILTLPLIQVLHKELNAIVDVVCTPVTSPLLKNNPYINDIIIFDKKGKDKGYRKLNRIINRIKFLRYDAIISPHRSARSSYLSYKSKVEKRISFDKSSLRFLYTDLVRYDKEKHEILRNLSLLKPLGVEKNEIIKPELFPDDEDKHTVELLLKILKIDSGKKFITIAPGSEWLTKRYPEYKYMNLLKHLSEEDIQVILIGSKRDNELCSYIVDNCENVNVRNAAGKLTLLQSAELIGKSDLLITNDSAPLHIANAMNTRVFAIFGATIPEFGFYPIGVNDLIFETKGLKCRPCGIHGGNKCPVKTFDCMKNISESAIAEQVIKAVT